MTQGVVITIIVISALVVIGALVALGFYWWRRTIRKSVATLMGRRASVEGALKTVEQVVSDLAAATDDDLVEFAQNPSAEQRHTLEEVAEQISIMYDEVATMPLPSRLIPAADALADAAGVLAKQTGALTGAAGLEALDALAAIDLGKVRADLQHGVDLLGELAEEYDVEDASFYGGGLYI